MAARCPRAEQKKPGTARFLSKKCRSRKNGFSKATANMSQFGQRKFLNFNSNRVNDRRVHDHPLLHKEWHRSKRVAEKATMGRSLREK